MMNHEEPQHDPRYEYKPKTFLTFEEKIKAAYLHFCKGIPIHTIASDIFDGINQGRPAEACKAIERALKGNGKNK